MWKLTKQYWIDVWNLLWSKTNIDEKALATVKELKYRFKLTAEELKDIAKAIIEVGDQIGDDLSEPSGITAGRCRTT